MSAAVPFSQAARLPSSQVGGQGGRTAATAMPPSPTAAVQSLIDPDRTSPELRFWPGGRGICDGGRLHSVGRTTMGGGRLCEGLSSVRNAVPSLIERKQHSAERLASSFAPRPRFGLVVRDAVLRLASFPLVADWLMRRLVADRFKLPTYPAASVHRHADAGFRSIISEEERVAFEESQSVPMS